MISQRPKRHFSCLLAVLALAGSSQGLFGQLLYIGNGGDDTISSFVIDQETGLLTELLPRVVSTGSPSSVAIHPSGKFAYVTNSGNPNLNVNNPSLASFSINPTTGALKLLKQSGPDTRSRTPGGGHRPGRKLSLLRQLRREQRLGVFDRCIHGRAYHGRRFAVCHTGES